MCYCDKLPKLFDVPDPFNWVAVQNKAYNFFLNDIVYRFFKFKGKRTYGSACGEARCHWERFEHIITKGDDEEERIPNIDRLKRITWIRPLIELNCNCEDYKVFPDTTKKNKKRWCIWCSKTNFIVILEDKGKNFRLITAFIVLYKNKRNDLETDYKNYIAHRTPGQS